MVALVLKVAVDQTTAKFGRLCESRILLLSTTAPRLDITTNYHPVLMPKRPRPSYKVDSDGSGSSGHKTDNSRVSDSDDDPNPEYKKRLTYSPPFYRRKKSNLGIWMGVPAL